VSRLAEGHRLGRFGLDAGEDDVTLCGVRGMGRGTVGVEVRGQRVVADAWSMLICAGWLPQDRVFGWSVARV
jgi:hypothetical protein